MLSHQPRSRNAGQAVAMAAAVGLLCTSGCFKATYINPAVTPGETHEEWTDFFLGGIVGSEEFDVREFCPGEAARVATGGNFLTGLVSVVTVFIYTPRKVYVTCAAAPPAQPMPVSGPPIPAATQPGYAPPAPTPLPQPPAAVVPTPATPGSSPAPAPSTSPAGDGQ